MSRVDRLLEMAHRVVMEIDVKTTPEERERIEAKERRILGKLKQINSVIHERVMA